MTTLKFDLGSGRRQPPNLGNLPLDSVDEASKILQENHESHHVFSNKRMGTHDHIAHHTLALLALGATPVQMREQYKRNASYQQNITEDETASKLNEICTYDGFMKHLTQMERYKDFLDLFVHEVETEGVLPTLDHFVFAEDARAKTLFSRLSAGVWHPMIHLGLAIEFDLPLMAAEALAWTAMHGDELGAFYDACASHATGADPKTNLIDIYQELQQYGDAAREAVPFESMGPWRHLEFLKIEDGVTSQIISRYRVSEETVQARIYEAMNVQAWVALAAQRRPFAPKGDFFLIHGHNASVYLPTLLQALGPKKAARLVEAQIRACLTEYISAGAPSFDIKYTYEFVKDPASQGSSTTYNSWEALYSRANTFYDDGHIAKYVRALKAAEEVAGMQGTFLEPLSKEDFLGLGGVMMRSVELEEDVVAQIHGGSARQWVRRAGFEQAWKGFERID